MVSAMEEDVGFRFSELRVDGGASASDILMQTQSDLLGICINRPSNTETTALGAAYMAGLHVGFWESIEVIESNRIVEREFRPQIDSSQREYRYAQWKRAVERSLRWADDNYKQ